MTVYDFKAGFHLNKWICFKRNYFHDDQKDFDLRLYTYKLLFVKFHDKKYYFIQKARTNSIAPNIKCGLISGAYTQQQMYEI